MLKIGLIAEFNPFHNGHIYLLSKIKEKYPNSQIIVALSDNYTQRGEITVAPFYKRARIAKKYGATKVIKLNFKESTQAAHIFAAAGINKLLKKKIDILFFGASDTNKIEKYINAAKKIKQNIDLYNSEIKRNLKTGKSFVSSCNEALKAFLKENEIPTDILGFEYTKYVIDNNLDIKLDCIKRSISHKSNLTTYNIASGTKLREMIKNNEDISNYSPLKIKKIKKIEDTYPKFKKIVLKTKKQKLKKILLINEGMENLFIKNIYAKTYDEFISLCISKRYTASRIKRAYLYVLKKVYK